MTTTDVATRTTGALAEKMEWSRAMAPGNLLPAQYRGNPANLLFAVEYADALGIERINALTSIHVIEGKPSASAELIAGLIRRAGHRLRISGNDQSATAQIIRADDPEYTYEATWDMGRAQRAGLAGKAVWKNYPAAMLRARAITEVARMGASDALLGVVYTPEELGVDVGADGLPTRPLPIPTAPVTAAEILDDAAPGAENVQDAEVIGEELSEPLMSDRQNRRMHALFKKLGIDDHEKQVGGISRAIGRTVTSKKELTEKEADFVISALVEREKAQPAPADDVQWPPVADIPGGAS